MQETGIGMDWVALLEVLYLALSITVILNDKAGKKRLQKELEELASYVDEEEERERIAEQLEKAAGIARKAIRVLSRIRGR